MTMSNCCYAPDASQPEQMCSAVAVYEVNVVLDPANVLVACCAKHLPDVLEMYDFAQGRIIRQIHATPEQLQLQLHDNPDYDRIWEAWCGDVLAMLQMETT